MGSCKCTCFAGAKSTLTLHCSTRNKQLQRQTNTTSAGTSLPEFVGFFSYILLTLFIYRKNVLYISPPTQGFSSKPFTSPPSSKEAFFSPCRFFNSKDVCVKKKKILPLCSFFYTSFLLSGWRDLDFSKCQNPLSGWLSDQAPPRWS